jgi:hypothetical protein
VLAGGARRVVPPEAFVGVHQIRAFQTLTRVRRLYRVFSRIVDGKPKEVSRKLVRESKLSERTVERSVTDRDYRPIRKYLSSLGVAESLVTFMLSAPNASMRWLTWDELRTTGLLTDQLPVDFLIKALPGAAVVPAVAKPAAALPVPAATKAVQPELTPAGTQGALQP